MKDKKEISIDSLYKSVMTAYKYYFFGLGILGLHDMYLKQYKKNMIRYVPVNILLIAALINLLLGNGCSNQIIFSIGNIYLYVLSSLLIRNF